MLTEYMATAPLSYGSEEKNALVVGFVAPFSLPQYIRMSDNQYKGAVLAVEEINESGGVGGRMVRIIPRDDTESVELAGTVTRELCEKEHVQLIAGSIGSDTQMPINEVAKEKGIPFISCSQSNDIGKAELRAPLTFHEALTPHMTSRFLVEWGYKNLGKKWAWVLFDHPWAQQGHEASMKFLNELGGREVGTVVVPFGGSVENYEKCFDELLSFKADVINVRNFGRDQTNFIKAAAKRGLNREAPVMLGISETQIVEDIPLDDLVGLYWATNFYWGLEDRIPTAKHFVGAFRKRFDGEVPSGYAGYAYSGVKEALTALRETNFDGTSYEKMKEFMEGRHYDHYKGAQWWRPCDHQSFQDLYIFRFKGPEESASRHDVAEFIDTVPWDLSIERDCEALGYSH